MLRISGIFCVIAILVVCNGRRILNLFSCAMWLIFLEQQSVFRENEFYFPFFLKICVFFCFLTGIHGQGGIIINTPICCGNFTLEGSNPCFMASCYNNANPGRLCEQVEIQMCVCEPPLVFDECTGTCIPEDCCPPPSVSEVCQKNNPVNPTLSRCNYA